MTLTALVSVSGCEAIVGDSLPGTVDCTVAPGACPVGQECAGGVCRACANPGCITFVTDGGHDAVSGDAFETDAGHDAAVDTADTGRDGAIVEAAPEASAPEGIGDPCESTAVCATGLSCLPKGDFSGVDVGAVGVCSKACCSNADCGGDNVCYPTTGGNLCITARVASACGATCGTSCCADTDCASLGDEFCAIGATSAGSSVAACRARKPGNECQSDDSCDGADEDDCYQDSDCDNGVCVSIDGDPCSFGDCACQPEVGCCQPSDCSGSDTCEWVSDTDGAGNSLVFRACQPASTSSDGQACCQDSDCTAAGAGFVCTPIAAMVGVGTLPILVCQAPGTN